MGPQGHCTSGTVAALVAAGKLRLARGRARLSPAPRPPSLTRPAPYAPRPCRGRPRRPPAAPRTAAGRGGDTCAQSDAAPAPRCTGPDMCFQRAGTPVMWACVRVGEAGIGEGERWDMGDGGFGGNRPVERMHGAAAETLLEGRDRAGWGQERAAAAVMQGRGPPPAYVRRRGPGVAPAPCPRPHPPAPGGSGLRRARRRRARPRARRACRA